MLPLLLSHQISGPMGSAPALKHPFQPLSEMGHWARKAIGLTLWCSSKLLRGKSVAVANAGFPLLFLSAAWESSTTRMRWSSATTTMLGCVQRGVSDSPSWTRRQGWRRVTATSGWRSVIEAQVSALSWCYLAARPPGVPGIAPCFSFSRVVTWSWLYYEDTVLHHGCQLLYIAASKRSHHSPLAFPAVLKLVLAYCLQFESSYQRVNATLHPSSLLAGREKLMAILKHGAFTLLFFPASVLVKKNQLTRFTDF